jgi:hypothetical protein
LSSAPLADGFGEGVRADAGRLLQLLRDSLQSCAAVFVSPGDRAADSLLLGGEIAFPTKDGTAPIALHRDFTDGKLALVDTIACAQAAAGGAAGELALARGGSQAWRAIPFLGELFPDDLGAEWMRDGNLAMAQGADRLAWTPLTGASFSDLPFGASLAGLHSSRMGPAGAAMLACCGPASATLTFAGITENALSPTENGSVSINHSVQSEPPTTLRTSRTIRAPANCGVVVAGLDATAAFPRSTLTKLDQTWTVGGDDAGAAFAWTSSSRGSATLALWTAASDNASSRTIAHQSLLLGFRALHAAGKPKLAARVPQTPRVTIVDPAAGSLAANPTSMTVRWTTEWLRYDGLAYTEAHAEPSDGDESDLVYRVMWSRDQGLTWTSALTGNAAIRGAFPDIDEQLADAGEGSEAFTFALPDDLPQTELLFAVEAWRASTHCHHASHQTRVFVRRSR